MRQNGWDFAGGLETAITSAARGRIEVGMVMPSDLAASHFTTTVVPTDTRL
jgi:hypothetical protein